MEIEDTIEIVCPIADVHAYLSDAAKLPEWIEGLREFKLLEDGRFQHLASQAGREVLLTGTITPGNGTERVEVLLESEHGTLEVVHRLTVTATGTRIDHHAQAKFNNPMIGMLAGAMKGPAQRHLREHLERLREQLEE